MNVLLIRTTYRDNESLPHKIEKLFWDLDEDMNGNNGEEYLWEEAKAKGFDCNLRYITQLYEDTMDDGWYDWDDHSQIDDCIKHFVKFYNREGYDYYQIGNACIDTNDNGETWNIAIPYVVY